jgi:hypothetical protein
VGFRIECATDHLDIRDVPGGSDLRCAADMLDIAPPDQIRISSSLLLRPEA